MSRYKKSAALDNIIKDIAGCEHCREVSGVGDIPVFPRGNPNADCMLVGEGPGEQEERQQKPFVGAAGRLLEDRLSNMGFNIERDFYITNIVKHRSYQPTPSGRKKNKPPTVKQIDAERGFLVEEISVVKPKLIVTLGAVASQWFLGKDFKLTENHGRLYNWHGTAVLPVYHPAAILRAYAVGDEDRRRDFERDLQIIKEIIQPGIAA